MNILILKYNANEQLLYSVITSYYVDFSFSLYSDINRSYGFWEGTV